MSRRILSEEEKRQIRERSPRCFICEKILGDPQNLVYDHIKSLAKDGTNDIFNFAAVHKECHKGKGTKDLEDYKEQLRLTSLFEKYRTFAALREEVKTPNVKIDFEGKVITFNGIKLPLYQDPNTHFWYFYHQIPVEFLASDVDTQPRPLESERLYNLAVHLRKAFQMSPSVCRFDTKENKILLFDGQHKAAAQIVGNRNKFVDCKVFIDPPVKMVFDVIEEGHGRLKQQTFKISDLAKKYRSMFDKEIKNWEETHGITPSEKQILLELKRMSKKKAREFIQKYISINVHKDESCVLSRYVSEKRKAEFPLTYRMYYRDLIGKLARLDPIDVPMESEHDFRAEEQKNMIKILNFIESYSIEGKWNPKNPESEHHRVTYNTFRESPFRYWTTMLADAVSFIVRRPVASGVCYGEEFNGEELRSIENACERLFEHSVWKDPASQTTLRSKNIEDIKNLFERTYGLNAGYLARPL